VRYLVSLEAPLSGFKFTEAAALLLEQVVFSSPRALCRIENFLPFGAAFAKKSPIPIGLELYSVREALKQDPEGTVRAVAALGYQCVEFYAPYFEWTEAQARSMRKLLDELGIRCYSTHNDQKSFSPENISRARDLNLALGTKYVVMAYSEPKGSPDGWKAIADQLNFAAERLEPAGLKPGYHNHQAEWKAVDGTRPMDVLAKQTKPSVMLQLDVGTCLEAGSDPVTWIRSNPGRIHSLHLKDWSDRKSTRLNSSH